MQLPTTASNHQFMQCQSGTTTARKRRRDERTHRRRPEKQRKQNKCFRFDSFFASAKWSIAINVRRQNSERIVVATCYLRACGMYTVALQRAAPSVYLYVLCACRILKITFASYAFVPAFYCRRICRLTHTIRAANMHVHCPSLSSSSDIRNWCIYLFCPQRSRHYAAKCFAQRYAPIRTRARHVGCMWFIGDRMRNLLQQDLCPKWNYESPGRY